MSKAKNTLTKGNLDNLLFRRTMKILLGERAAPLLRQTLPEPGGDPGTRCELLYSTDKKKMSPPTRGSCCSVLRCAQNARNKPRKDYTGESIQRGGLVGRTCSSGRLGWLTGNSGSS